MAETKFFSKEIILSPESQPAKATFPARLAYRVFGSPKNPAVLLPSCFGGTLSDTLPILFNPPENDDDSPQPLPTSRFCIIVVGLLGGGESSSPSNTPSPWNGPHFPHLTYQDNVVLQHALCTEELGIHKLFAYIGFSMGGQLAYHMAAAFPDFVANAVCLAGSARTSMHNWSFLEGPRHALIMSKDFHDGKYTEPVKAGMKAFSRVYSTWALCPEWFRQKSWKKHGFSSLQEYLDAYWSGGMDANDALALVWTWQKGDISVYHPEDGQDLSKALGRIKARMLLMPCKTDMYFPPEDNEEEVKHLKSGKVVCINSICGHTAGGGGSTREDAEFIKQAIKQFLDV